MSRILKTYTGKHPFAGDDLEFLSQADNEQAVALAKSLTPKGVEAYALTGCEITQSGGTVAIAEGWVYWSIPGVGAKLLRVPATSVTTVGLVNVRLRYDAEVNAPGWPSSVVYRDTSSKRIYLEDQLRLILTTDMVGGDKVLCLTAVSGVVELVYGSYEQACEGDFKDWTVPTGKTLADYFDSDGIGFGKQRGWCIARGQTIGGVAMPDLRGRVRLGAGQLQLPGETPATGETYADKQLVGEEKHKLTTSEMPTHNHTGSGQYNRLAGFAEEGVAGRTATAYDAAAVANEELDLKDGATLAPAGGGASHENRQPSYVTYTLYRYMA